MRYLDLHVSAMTYPGVDGAHLFPRLVDIAATAERSGFTALSLMDHFHQIPPHGQPDEPLLESYTTLGALAARTERLELLTLVTGVIYHNPAHLAKKVTTLDVISQGRAILGIGAAWNDEESRAYGFDFPPIGERMDRLEEALIICRAMLDQGTASFEGRHYRIEGAHNMPRPVRRRVPILVGGGGERRTLRLVARHADMCNVIGDAPTIRHKLEVLREHCDAEGRDYDSIVKTAAVGAVVIDETEAGVRRRLERIAASPPPMLRGLDVDELSRRLVAGTPDQVTERLRACLDAGAEGLTMVIRGVEDLEPIELAGAAARAAAS
ncbi:MAG TPA: LLM class F420-dependent oxidoreductase [Candidatus Dormibacteraeota bacterium]